MQIEVEKVHKGMSMDNCWFFGLEEDESREREPDGRGRGTEVATEMKKNTKYSNDSRASHRCPEP